MNKPEARSETPKRHHADITSTTHRCACTFRLASDTSGLMHKRYQTHAHTHMHTHAHTYAHIYVDVYVGLNTYGCLMCKSIYFLVTKNTGRQAHYFDTKTGLTPRVGIQLNKTAGGRHNLMIPGLNSYHAQVSTTICDSTNLRLGDRLSRTVVSPPRHSRTSSSITSSSSSW